MTDKDELLTLRRDHYGSPEVVARLWRIMAADPEGQYVVMAWIGKEVARVCGYAEAYNRERVVAYKDLPRRPITH